MKSAAPRATVDTVAAPAASKGVAMVDNRAVTVAQRQAQAAIDNSPRQVAQRQQAEALAPRKNTTGLPDNLKAGVERLSGYSLDDVQVYYNSAKPAQLQAHAYAQGTDIHVAPGQEQHLPHEAWHVVQQKQGRVQATRQLKGRVNVNDDAGLEKEADLMGAEALGFNGKQNEPHREEKVKNETVQRAAPAAPAAPTRLSRAEFLGGAANESHIHQYRGGFHLKLGSSRFNIVQGGRLNNAGLAQAREALNAITGNRMGWAQEMLGYLNPLIERYNTN